MHARNSMKSSIPSHLITLAIHHAQIRVDTWQKSVSDAATISNETQQLIRSDGAVVVQWWRGDGAVMARWWRGYLSTDHLISLQFVFFY